MAIRIDGATGSSEKWCRVCDLDKLGKSDTEPDFRSLRAEPLMSRKARALGTVWRAWSLPDACLSADRTDRVCQGPPPPRAKAITDSLIKSPEHSTLDKV